MQYDYDYFISYAHVDNENQDAPGFIKTFAEKLCASEDHQRMFGRKIKVFLDTTEIKNMSDWDNKIRASLASSRFFIVLLSPNYFKSEYCAREFDWWMQHEMHRHMLGEGTAPMLIVDVDNLHSPDAQTIADIPERLQKRFPNWLKQIRKIQAGPQFDMHDLDRARINDVLVSLRDAVKERVQRQDNAEKSPNNALYPRYNENFVGRRENLRSLRYNLSEQDAARFVALTGLGGFGKTELALTYGHAFAWDYQLGRVFVNCENKTSLTDILLSSGIAEMNGWELPNGTNEQQLEFLFNHLKVKRDRIVQYNKNAGNLNALGAHILLILDNVNKLELIKKENLDILPEYFHVIITTRETPNEFPYIHSEPVDRLSEDESVELLSDLRPFGSDESESKAALQIAQSLDGFTLVVELTGAYLARNPDVTYQQQYKDLVESHPETFQTMADRTRRLTRHSADTVAVVLESTLSKLSPNTCKALEYASVMAPDAVGFSWLPELVGLDENEGKKILAELTGYSLLSQLENEPNIARIHRLVAETVKKGISECVQKEMIAKIREKCNALLNKNETFWCTSKNSWNITPVSEFCLTLADHWKVEASEGEIDWNLTWLLDASGDMLNALGQMNEVRVVFQRCFEMCEERDKAFPESVDVQRDLSVSYGKLGDLENAAGNAAAARDWYEKALEIHKLLADLMPDNVDAQRDLGVSYGKLGDMEKATGNAVAARERYEKALEIRKLLANQMPDNVDFQRDLSVSCERLGDLEKVAGNVAAARDWYEKTLEICKRLANLMQDNVKAQQDLSISYNKLGDLEYSLGKAAAAWNWYEKGLEIRKRLADLMPDNVSAQHDLSVSYGKLGDLENAAGNAAAARKWYEKALPIFQRLSDLMMDDVQAQRYLSALYESLGDLESASRNADAAREWHEKALEIRNHLVDLMPDNVEAQRDLSVSYERLGNLAIAAGNVASASEWYEKAQEISKRLADLMPDNVQAQRDLGVSYIKLGYLEKTIGNVASAQAWCEKALEIYKRLACLMPDNVQVQKELAALHNILAQLQNSHKTTPDNSKTSPDNKNQQTNSWLNKKSGKC